MSVPLSRRDLLLAAAVRTPASGIRREVFARSPSPGVAVMAYAFYTEPRGGAMVSIEERWSRSDTVDVAYIRRSRDHGRQWGEAETFRTGEKRPGGTFRLHPRCCFVDASGRFLEFKIEGLLPTDDPLEGLRQWNIHYRVSGGPWKRIVHEGAEYNDGHPLPGVWTGKNCVMLGDMACAPVNAPDGHILLPVQMTPLGPDGKLANPGGGYTYTDVAVLHGRWRGSSLSWTMSDVVRGDPRLSTRGMDEGTLGQLDDGGWILIMRGANDRHLDLPSYRWISRSSDGGRRWTAPEPWTYDDSQPFFSPSSCSQLVRHHSGRLFWLGNITPANPRGNRPRYPFVIGEVDRRSGLLKRSTIRQIDGLAPGEDPILSLSNFYAREDRETGGIALHMARLFAGGEAPWSGDAYLYRIPV